jgi:hypothetical protein
MVSQLLVFSLSCFLPVSASLQGQIISSPVPPAESQLSQQPETWQEKVGVPAAPAFGTLLKVVTSDTTSTPPPSKTDVPKKPDLKVIQNMIDMF